MLLVRFNLALIFLGLLAPAANAMFIPDYATWKKAPAEIQLGFVIGVMDSWTRTSTPGEPSWMKVQRTGINKCMRELKINSGMLVELVNSHYQAYPADWRLPPALVVHDVVMGTCLADVNKEREKVGLSPWPRKSGQISSDK